MGIPIRRIFKTRQGVLIGTGSAAAALGVSLLYLVGPGANSPDTRIPEVAFSAPRNTQVITGTTFLKARARDNVAVSCVQFKVDGVNVGPCITSPPYEYSWDSTLKPDGAPEPDGDHIVAAVAVDTSSLIATKTKAIVTTNGNVGSCTELDQSGCDSVGGTFVTYTDNTLSDGGANVKCWNGGGSLDKALKDYNFVNYSDKHGSGWPVHININFTNHGSYNYTTNQAVSAGTIVQLDGVYLGDHCTGDGTIACDLIENVQGDGRTFGLQGDLLKGNGATGPHDIQVCGGVMNSGPRFGSNSNIPDNAPSAVLMNGSDVINGLPLTGAPRATTMPISAPSSSACSGKIASNATVVQILSTTSVRMSSPATGACTDLVKIGFTIKHTDCTQIQHGNHITFWGITCGYYTNTLGKHATCECGGGGFFFSVASGASIDSIEIHNSHFDVCNRAIGGNINGTNTNAIVGGNTARSGDPADRAALLAVNDPNLVAQGASDTRVHGICDNAANPPIQTGTPGVTFLPANNNDPWAQTGQSWSPGYDPAYDLP